MDYLDHIEKIIEKLNNNKEEELATKIKYLKDDACTSSELLMSVTYELIKFTKVKQKNFDLIGQEVIELRDYCYSIGLLVK